MTADGGVDSDTLGRATWTFLHTLAATHPASPTAAQQVTVTRFMRDFAMLYPCAPCAESFRAILERHPVDAATGPRFARWMCVVHNQVNEELSKPVFDCDKVGQRWGVCEQCAAHSDDLADFKKLMKNMGRP